VWVWPHALESFGKILQSIPGLVRLKMQYCGEHALAGWCIGAALEGSTALRMVNLQGSPFVEIDFDRMTRSLSKRGVDGPLYLNLEGCVKDVGVRAEAFYDALIGQHASVERLNLGFNELDAGPHLDTMCRALASNSTLRELDLGANPLNWSMGVIGTLCDALAQQRGLEALILSNTTGHPAGAAQLADWLLSGRCSLTALELDGCELGPDGAATLGNALGTPNLCAPIQKLRIEYNQLGEQGAVGLAKGLPANNSLRALYLGTNMLGELGARTIGRALALNSRIETLDISDNAIGEMGLRAILEGVRAQHVLTAMDVSDNHLGDDGAMALAKDLVSSSCQFLRVAGNSIRVEGGHALADAFDASESMLLLDVARNPKMAYQDIIRLKLRNNKHVTSNNPLDTTGGADDCR